MFLKQLHLFGPIAEQSLTQAPIPLCGTVRRKASGSCVLRDATVRGVSRILDRQPNEVRVDQLLFIGELDR